MRLTPLDQAKFFSKNSLKIIQKYSIEIRIEWCVNHAYSCNSFGKKSKSAVADGKALSLARTQLAHKVSLLIVYAERIIIISHHTKLELANLKR